MFKNHPQLDPSLNRARGAGGFPAEPDTTDYPRVDPENPYVNTTLGIVDTPITDGFGKERALFGYIPKTEKSAWNMALILVPGKTDPKAFFRQGRWQETLEKNEMTGYFLPAPDGWNKEDIGCELETCVRALAEMRSNRYFQSNAPGIYCFGFGDGAAVASLFAITHVSVLAAWGACGDTSLDEDLVSLLGNAPSDCDPLLKRCEVPLPTYVFDMESSNVVSYFKKANRTEDRHLHNEYAKIYPQKPALGESYRNDRCCSDVWVALPAVAMYQDLPFVCDQLATFAASYKRWGGEGNGHIRPTVLAERDGLVYTETRVDDLKRHWWTFEPDGYHRGRQESFPLVIAIHGFTCTGEFFANNSGWVEVGKERDCFVVFPTAYPYHRSIPSPHGTHIATPEWNAGGMPIDPEGPNELNYFKVLLEKTLEKYPIDRSRIYVTGHSNGAMMTQCLMRNMPEVFAGFAPVGFMENLFGTMEPEPDDGIIRNVHYVVGEFDGKGITMEEDGCNVTTMKLLCQHNKISYESAKTYESGIYRHTVIRDSEGAPLVSFTGIRNWPHTYTPELAFQLYDEFFMLFQRNPDGSLTYLA